MLKTIFNCLGKDHQKKKNVRRIASKLGLIYNTNDNIDIIKNKIIQYLVSSKIAEPIQVSIKKEKKKNNFTSFTAQFNKGRGGLPINVRPEVNRNKQPILSCSKQNIWVFWIL